MGADITTKVSRGAVTLNVPPFLEELKTKLPDKFIGAAAAAVASGCPVAHVFANVCARLQE